MSARAGCMTLADTACMTSYPAVPSNLTRAELAVLLMHMRLTSTAQCRATGAQALVSLGTPNADELGFAKALTMEEIGGQMVIRLEQDAAHGKVWDQTHCSIPVRCWRALAQPPQPADHLTVSAPAEATVSIIHKDL